jgi:aminoglycoside phosphotransferase (APT) family kinase protein
MPAVDLAPRLAAWLADEALPGQRLTGQDRLTGGFRNDNLLLRTGTGDRYVLRRYLKPEACPVEAALAQRLAGVLPVPEVIAADPAGDRAGEPVLLTRFLPGVSVADLLDRPADGQGEAVGQAIGAVLAAIGTVRFERPGFFDGPRLEPGPPGMDPTMGLAEFVDRCLGTENAQRALSTVEQEALRRLAERWMADLEAVRGARQLVHADFNPKNLLAVEGADGWRISGVLDWEFAYSSSPLFDVGNMLRDERPPGFTTGLVAGYCAHGGRLPENWRQLSQALDLFSLADFLTRPPDAEPVREAPRTIRRLLAG